jgi:putative transposase
MEKTLPTRKSVRLKEYDYSLPGYYFVTICTKDRRCLFGKIISGKMYLNNNGEIVKDVLNDLKKHNFNIKLDYYSVMPNHLHLILILETAIRTGLEPVPTNKDLPEIVRQLKTYSSKRINILNNTTGTSVWQRSFYEHIIRNDKELYEIRRYIEFNPLNWNEDEYNK